MLRIHFTAEDLAGVRMLPSWGPLSESLFSLSALRRREPNPLHPWRQQVVERLGNGNAVGPLLGLVQPGTPVDLHTLVGPQQSMAEALDELRRVPAAHLKAELAELPQDPGYDAGRDDRRSLALCLARYYSCAIDPYWDRIRSHLDAEVGMRSRIMMEGGVERLLTTLPRSRWRSPVLEVAGPRDRDVYLRGRSLVLVPSVFRLGGPMLFYSLADHDAPEVLFFPAVRGIGDAAGIWNGNSKTTAASAVQALIGRSRAAILESVVEPCTTTELARRVGVAPATATHHASILRQAGLIVTRRHGGAVLHSITRRGAALRDGANGS